MYNLGQRRIQGGDRPPKTYESNFIHNVYTIQKKKHSRLKTIFSSIFFVTAVLWSSLYFISLTVEKLLWDLTAKYYWNRPPLKLLAGSSPNLGENTFNELSM